MECLQELPRYWSDDLIGCTAQLFVSAGLDGPIAGAVAEILVEADLLGYDTHGLQFVPAYLAAVEAGRTTLKGEPKILNDSGGSLLLDARSLPGQWVVVRALDLARQRIREHLRIPTQSGQCFRSKTATDSNSIRPPFPIQNGQFD
ncbi:MAG: Ldh family oxidoreductase [Proteobacteria bacterium]|nr:Ldh family oxidoreductase [Pseudomonadota bacterium]